MVTLVLTDSEGRECPLCIKGFVSFEGQEGDSRVQPAVPILLALRYFAERAKVIELDRFSETAFWER